MKISELLQEGMFVVKSKDGVEKRFKSADSPEAKAWKEKTAKKAPKSKPLKFSAEWWDESDADVLPWDKIEFDGAGQISELIADNHMGRGPDDWTFGRTYQKDVNGVRVAGRVVRAMYMITKDDDLGTGDEPVEHSENFGIVRDVKNPSKFVFDGYKN